MTSHARRWCLDSIRFHGWAPVTVLLLHAAAKLLGLYGSVPQVDVPMHFLGGIAIAYCFWRSLQLPAAEPVIGQLTLQGRALLTATAVCTTALFWEFAEWILRSTRNPAQMRVSDTLLDLVVGLFGGALLLAWTLRLALRPRRAAGRAGA